MSNVPPPRPVPSSRLARLPFRARLIALSLALLFAGLPSCSDGETNGDVPVADEAPRPWNGVHLFELAPESFELPDQPFPPEIANHFDEGEVWIADERINGKAWLLDETKTESTPAGDKRTRILAATRFPVIGPTRVVAIEDADRPGAGRIEGEDERLVADVDDVRIGPRGVELVRGEGTGYPKDFRVAYPTRLETALEVLLGSTIVAEQIASPGTLELAKQARRVVTLPPPGRITWRLRVPDEGQIAFGYGLRALAFGVEDGVLTLSGVDARSSDLAGTVGFRVEVETEDGERTLVWQRSLDGPRANRSIGTTVDLAKWSGREVLLHVVTHVPEGAEPERGLVPFLAEPVLDAPRPDGPPNLLVILLDTLRADRLGCYGYDRGLSPNIDELARKGVVFADAMSPAPMTLPSHASLFCSLYPSQHGLWHRERLPESATTIAEVLHDEGYRTMAFTEGIFVHHEFGLAQGFDQFDIGVLRAERTFDRALASMRSCRGPYFSFVHTYEVHAPYDPPEEQRRAFVREYSGTLPREIVPHGWSNRASDDPLTPEDKRYISDLYDAEIAHVDAEVGRLLGVLEEEGKLENTLVVITSDHGEEFDDHGRYGHGHTLYQEQLHVPLILWWKGVFEGGRVVEHPVHLVDLAPTLAQAGGAKVPETWIGALLGLQETATDRPLFAPYTGSSIEPIPVALRDGPVKVIHSPAGLRHFESDVEVHAEVYQFERDPKEQDNLFGADDACRWHGSMEELLRRYGPVHEASAANVASSHASGIEKLGYTGGD